MTKHAPSFRTLSAFETSARLGSFTRASQELHLTPSAVSHQVAKLEESLGTKLFVRQDTGVQLTSSGAAYLKKVQSALSLISEGVDAVANVETELRLHSTPSFAVLWLMPRLPGFMKAHPEIKVRLAVSPIASDFARDQLDLEIRYGVPEWPFLHIESIFSESVRPLASPSLLEACPVKHPHDLLDKRLISTEVNLVSWSTWFAANGVPVSPSNYDFRCDRSYVILEAAVQGMGFVLENDLLAQRYIRSGQLVPVFDDSRSIPVRAHHVVSSAEKVQTFRVATFLQWLRDEAAADFVPRESRPSK